MILGTSLKSVYEKHKTELRLLMALDKPPSHTQLEYAITDLNGVKYYKFPQDASIPIERWGKLNEYMMWMSSGLTGGELDKLVAVAEEAIAQGLKQDTRNIAKISTVLNEIKERKNMVIHTELFYNYVSVQLVREDENPDTFNNEIHLQKVEQFKREVAAGNSYDFFFSIGLKKLSALMDMSKSEWEQFWNSSQKEQELLSEKLKIIESAKKSANGVASGAKK
jgi:hypothetical protein